MSTESSTPIGSLLQQPPEQVVQEHSRLRAHIGEFHHAHSLVGGDVTHNRLGLNQASGNFKKQRQCGAHWPHMVCQKEQSSRTQGLEDCSFRQTDRKSTRLNSSHRTISYAVFCLKKKKNKYTKNT